MRDERRDKGFTAANHEADCFLEKPPIVADTVTGSRKDLTIGPITHYWDSGSGVCPQEKRENAVQGVVGGKRSGTFGADLPSKRNT